MMLETLFPNLSFKFIVLTSILKCVDINFYDVCFLVLKLSCTIGLVCFRVMKTS